MTRLTSFITAATAAIVLCLGGCSHDTPKEDSSGSQSVYDIKPPLEDAKRQNDRAKLAVDSITTQNLPEKKPVAVDAVKQTGEAIGRVMGAVDTAIPKVIDGEKKSAEKDVRIAELEAAPSYLTVWLTRAGVGFIIIGGILIVVGIVLTLKGGSGGTASIAGIACSLIGSGICIIPLLIKTLVWLIIGVSALVAMGLLIGLAWTAWKWRQNHQAVVSVQQVIAQTSPDEAVKAALRIGQTPQAEAIFRSVVKPKLTEKHR